MNPEVVFEFLVNILLLVVVIYGILAILVIIFAKKD